VKSCTVTAANGDLWSTLVLVLGGESSLPITTKTTYTLKCLDRQSRTLTIAATVTILPTIQEL
jgi:hypothetical protein